MAILTDNEAAAALNYMAGDEMPPKVTGIILPAVDAFIKSATGKDWGKITDSYKTIDPIAKMAASMLLVKWFEDSNEMGKAGIGVIGLIGQLQAKALLEKTT